MLHHNATMLETDALCKDTKIEKLAFAEHARVSFCSGARVKKNKKKNVEASENYCKVQPIKHYN